MVPTISLTSGAYAAFFDTLLPDFALAAIFFTALGYAVLGRQFKHTHRVAAALSVVLGVALAIGLVWWEQQHGYTIRNLGPLAVGLALIFLAMAVYQAFKLAGGTVAGAGLAIGIALVVAWLLQVDWPADSGRILSIISGGAIIIGMIALFSHHSNYAAPKIRYVARPVAIRHDMGNVYNDRYISEQLRRGFRQLRKQTDQLTVALWCRPVQRCMLVGLFNPTFVSTVMTRDLTKTPVFVTMFNHLGEVAERLKATVC